MDVTFASAEDEKQIKDLLAASALHYQDIDPSQLHHFLVVKENSASSVIGVVGLEPNGDAALLRSLAVARAYRRQGLATRLVSKIEAYARSQGVAILYLLTLTAEDFFAERGYQRTDRESAPPALRATTEFKTLCPQTATCMQKNL